MMDNNQPQNNPAQPVTQPSQAQIQQIFYKKESGWIKFLRVLIYALSIPATTVGAALIKSATLSSSYTDGSHQARLTAGYIIFWIGLVVLCLNIFWGILRWFLRGYRQQWKAGKIIGKLIGGGIWRTLIIVPLLSSASSP